jgi:3'-5' exoribonuclease
MATLVSAVLAGDMLEHFCVWPAAHIRHGAVRHGLLEHSLRVALLAERLADGYGDVLALDRDLVVAACLLHDVGKVYTLPEVPGGAIPEAAFDADHVTRGVLLVHAGAMELDRPLSAARLDRLTHAILAHHGRKEWGAPVEPRTAEALLVHVADYAESRLSAWASLTSRAQGQTSSTVAAGS